MFDGSFRTGVDRVTDPVGRGLVRIGISADQDHARQSESANDLPAEKIKAQQVPHDIH